MQWDAVGVDLYSKSCWCWMATLCAFQDGSLCASSGLDGVEHIF